MAGLVPAIHVLAPGEDVDDRDIGALTPVFAGVMRGHDHRYANAAAVPASLPSTALRVCPVNDG